VAKKKSVRKAARGGKKRSKKQPRLPTTAAMAGVNRKTNDPADVTESDQAIADGIALTRPVTQVIATHPERDLAGTQAAEINSVLATLLKPISEQISELSEKIDDIPKPPKPDDISKLAADRVSLESRRLRRREIWLWEKPDPSDTSSKYSLPRPSIIGRAMCDLQADRDRGALTPAAVFQWIEEHGSHHLSETIRKLLRRYRPQNGNVNTDVSGKIGKHFKKRLQRLIRGNYARVEGLTPLLTGLGLGTFEGWPDWSALDDGTDAAPSADSPGRIE